MLKIDERAAKNLNARAMRLLEELDPLEEEIPIRSEGHFEANLEPSGTIDIKQSKILEISLAGRDGIKDSIFFVDDSGSQLIGFEGQAYQDFLYLAESMHRGPSLYLSTSERTVRELIFNWIGDSYCGKTNEEMVSVVLEGLRDAVSVNKIWIPVPHLILSEPLDIGKISLQTLDAELFDSWLYEWNAEGAEYQAANEKMFSNYRKRFQGRSAAFIEIIAEPERALEIAFQDAEQSISILRYFDPAMQDPMMLSYLGLDGKYLIPNTFAIVRTGHRIPAFGGQFIETPPIPWKLTSSWLAIIRSNGLDTLSEMLTDDKRSAFEKNILDSMLIYTRSALETDLVDKIIYIFAALESILLRKSDRSNAKPLGERMAQFIGDGSDDIKQIKADVEKVYEDRSKFLHHGEKSEDSKALRRFMKYTWLFFNNLLIVKDEFQNKRDFIQHLEDKKRTS